MSERGPNVYAISRDFWDDPDFSDAAFTDREAWIWLIGAAAWKELRTRGSVGAPITLGRGEFSFSIRFLAEKWGWSKSAVDRFLAKLEKRDMVRDDHRDASGTAPGHERDKEEAGVTGVTGEITDRSELTLPLSDPRDGSDEVGAGPVQAKGVSDQRASVCPSASAPKIAVRSGCVDGFERFWRQSYPPKHASKAKARAAWVKTRRVRPPDDVLIASHAAYRASVAAENAKRREERPPRAALSLCHPETFLIEQRWESFLGEAMVVPVEQLDQPGERVRRVSFIFAGPVLLELPIKLFAIGRDRGNFCRVSAARPLSVLKRQSEGWRPSIWPQACRDLEVIDPATTTLSCDDVRRQIHAQRGHGRHAQMGFLLEHDSNLTAGCQARCKLRACRREILVPDRWALGICPLAATSRAARDTG